MVPIKQKLVNEAMYGTKCPYTMNPTRIVVHNTANDASAENEISYMSRNGNEVSFHYAVDDQVIIQGIPENRNAWHAGDGGTGVGNRQGIAIEICYSKSGGDKFIQAERNAAEFIASKLKQYGWGIDRVTKHQDYDGKNCPHRTLQLGWQRFLDMVNSYMGGQPAPTPQPLKWQVGTPVCVASGYGTPYGIGLINGDYEGVIKQIEEGAPYPYLINDRMWVNDALIDADPHVPGQAKPISSPIKVGDWVGVRAGASDYNGNAAGGVVKGVVYYTADEIKDDRVVLDIPGICTPFRLTDLFK